MATAGTKRQGSFAAKGGAVPAKVKKATAFPVWTVEFDSFLNPTDLSKWVTRILNSLPGDRAASAKVAVASLDQGGITVRHWAYVTYLSQ